MALHALLVVKSVVCAHVLVGYTGIGAVASAKSPGHKLLFVLGVLAIYCVKADKVAVIEAVSSIGCPSVASTAERCNTDAALFGYKGHEQWSGKELRLRFAEVRS